MKKILFLLIFFPLFIYSKDFEPWGKDATLISSNKSIESYPPPSLLTKVANQVILFRQNTLTKIDGPRSHFRPTSSKYMQLAMYRYGFFKGFIMGCDRLMRENNDKWVYRSIHIDGNAYNYDPAVTDKYFR